jgi:hypothetical protein
MLVCDANFAAQRVQFVVRLLRLLSLLLLLLLLLPLLLLLCLLQAATVQPTERNRGSQ